MKELVVISGKGGTGKTSIVGAFAALAEGSVTADCDVDAADLHLLLEPEIERREPFRSGRRASVIPEQCTACGRCASLCRFDAIRFDGPGHRRAAKTYRIDPIGCEGCGVCSWNCPDNAIVMQEPVVGEWYVSRTRFGPMVHAKLGIAEENSGKLVALVRKEARLLAEKENLDLLLVDGSPGIGCPVIASITAADFVLVVTEPTLSGLHDLERVRELTRHFGIATAVCINKYDLNKEIAAKIEAIAQDQEAPVLGKVRYDPAFTQAQIKRLTVVEYTDSGVAEDIKALWQRVSTGVRRSTGDGRVPLCAQAEACKFAGECDG